MHDPGCSTTWPGCGPPGSGRASRPQYGRDRVVPYVFPTPGMLAGLPSRASPPAVHGRAGRFCYDTMTLVGPGSWAAIRGAADAALTAADLVELGGPAGLRAVPAAGPSRHPGRLRRLLLPQQRRDRRPGAARGRGGRVAVLDIDAHHGNGTQMIFYGRADVYYGSVHVDPGAGWFPHYLGYAGERGGTRGRAPTATCRCRRAPATRAGWRRCRALCADAAAHRPDAVVVSLGLDAADPTRRARCGSPRHGYREAALARRARRRRS